MDNGAVLCRRLILIHPLRRGPAALSVPSARGPSDKPPTCITNVSSECCSIVVKGGLPNTLCACCSCFMVCQKEKGGKVAANVT